MKESTRKKVWDYLSSCPHGNTIDNIMDATGLARGTVKPNLFYLMLSDNVVEYVYGQNTKVYKIKHKKYKNDGLINSIIIE